MRTHQQYFRHQLSRVIGQGLLSSTLISPPVGLSVAGPLSSYSWVNSMLLMGNKQSVLVLCNSQTIGFSVVLVV